MLKWMGLTALAAVAVVIGSVLSEVTVEVLHIFGVGSGTCGESSEYVVGCIVGYAVCKNGWL